jgi:transcriptional regulator with XRE-family HTH domain
MFDRELKKIGERIAEIRKSRGWTQEMLAEKLNIARNMLTKLEGGFRDFKSTEIINIAKVLGVSTDFLLGLTNIQTPEVEERDVIERYGLCKEALNALSDMPTFTESSKDDVDQIAKERCYKTLSYRAVINLLLSEEKGKNALQELCAYYFGYMSTGSEAPTCKVELDIGNGTSIVSTDIINDNLLKEFFFSGAKNNLYSLWKDRDDENFISFVKSHINRERIKANEKQ